MLPGCSITGINDGKNELLHHRLTFKSHQRACHQAQHHKFLDGKRTIKMPSPSVSGFLESVPVSVSSTYTFVPVSRTSSHPSPSSSRSSSNGGTLVESTPVSAHRVCHPHLYPCRQQGQEECIRSCCTTFETAFGPSHIPSASLSGLVGLVPVSDSSTKNQYLFHLCQECHQHHHPDPQSNHRRIG